MEKADLQSAVTFVEGGIQDSCDDDCSICLESFCEKDPSTVTCCKHEFHLHCILEWSQRSSQWPMCWQAITLKDPTSQELLEGVERERNTRFNRPCNATIFHHPSIGDLELQHLPVGANDSELEERIIWHLAAAAMGRSHHIARRAGQRDRQSARGHPQFLVFSTNSNASSVGSTPATSAHRGDENEYGITGTNIIPRAAIEAHQHQATHVIHGQGDAVTLSSGNSVTASNRPDISNSRSLAGQSSLNNQDSAGASDFQFFSESLKSRLSAVSMRLFHWCQLKNCFYWQFFALIILANHLAACHIRYRVSITNSTHGWKERFFSRNASMSDIGSEVRREVDAGIATVS